MPGVRFRPSSFSFARLVQWKNEPLVRVRRRIVTCNGHQCSNSPTGRDDALRSHAVRVRILLGAPVCTSSPTAETAASNPAKSEFKSRDVHHAAVAQLAEADDLNPSQCRIVACRRHQSCSVRQMGRHRFYTATLTLFDSGTEYQRVFSSEVERLPDMQEAAGSIPARRTISLSRRLVAKARGR
jgi:hypothetical protein